MKYAILITLIGIYLTVGAIWFFYVGRTLEKQRIERGDDGDAKERLCNLAASIVFGIFWPFFLILSLVLAIWTWGRHEDEP